MSFFPAGIAGLEGAIGGAKSIALSAYLLDARGPLVGALEAAGDRGAGVRVVLEGKPVGVPRAAADGIARANAWTATELRKHGVDVVLRDEGAFSQHLKAAVVDGCAFLDDRNWTATDTLIETRDAPEVACVSDAVAGHPSSTPDLATTKAAAIALEAAAIAAGSGDRVDCASESFGTSAVSAALARRAQAGAHVRLVVNDRALRGASQNELRALARLEAAGVDVRAGSSTDKVCVAGDRAWLGSANPTFSPPPPMLDWGLATADPALAAMASATFASAWARARPVVSASLAELSG